jgi:hypothetical protein
LGGGNEGRGTDVVGNPVETAFKVNLGCVEQAGFGNGIKHEAIVAAAANSGAEVEIEGRAAADTVHTVVEGGHSWAGLKSTVGGWGSSCEVRGYSCVGVVFLELR